MANEQNSFKQDNKRDKKSVPNIDRDIKGSNYSLNDSKEHYSETKFNNSYNKKEERVENLQEQYSEKLNKKKIHASVKIFGVICIVISIFAIVSFRNISKATNMSEADKQALKEGYSTTILAGTVLGNAEANTSKDYDITHKSDDEETKIYVWDYADVDGDYIQVLVDDVPISETFIIKHKPREFTVPTVGKVQVKGIRDGGGGITYAVRYDLNGMTYFNYADEGKLNTYTLNKE